MRLTPEQEDILNTWDEGQAVVAGAGCGKTTTLVLKCEALLQRKPDARLIAVSFTEKSASDLREKLARKIDLEEGGHWVMTIHGLCAQIVRSHAFDVGLDGSEAILTEPAKRALWEEVLQRFWGQELSSEEEKAFQVLSGVFSEDKIRSLLVKLEGVRGSGALQGMSQAHDPMTRALLVLAEAIGRQFESEKRRQGVLDFGDLELFAREIIRDPKRARGLGDRFDLILVDEFQDTNPIQAEIVWALARPDRSNLLLVGDPKQSIYRFREADVSVFESLCKELPRQRTLSWNFRSRPGIIEFTNEVCEPAFAASALAYQPLIAKRTTRDDDLRPVRRLDVSSPMEFARWLRREPDLGETAILFRRLRGAEVWIDALKSEGVPFALLSGGLFWSDPRVRECVSLLKWWQNPSNTESAVHFLRSPWMGLSDLLIHEMRLKDETFLAPVLELNSPISAVLRRFHRCTVSVSDLLLGFLDDPFLEQELGAQLLGLWHRASERARAGATFSSVVREFEEGVNSGLRETDIPPPAEEGQVRILTVHGSKGLEFPRVYLVEFDPKPKASQRAPDFYWDRKEGFFLGKRDQNGKRDSKHEDEKKWKALEAQKELAEQKRVFYVALTRAQESLGLVCLKASEEEQEKIESAVEEGAFERFFPRAWIEPFTKDIREEILSDALELPASGFSSTEIDPASPLRLTWQRPNEFKRARHSVSEWMRLLKCERQVLWGWSDARRLDEDEARDQDPESQTELGVRVHRALELESIEELHRVEADFGGERFRAEAAIEWLRAQSGSEVYREWMFESQYRDEVLVGVIDRLDFDPSSGVCTLTDFKVTSSKPSEKGLLERYAFQAQVYAWVLARELGLDRDHIRARLVVFSAGVSSALEIEVPLEAWVFGAPTPVDECLDAIHELLSEARTPRVSPGLHCQHCGVADRCDQRQ